ncbi:MAG: hypothetical protein LRZ84_25125 [Desertifilum sp.]|nr:hypothetical protein [Oscillatoria laete-virens]MCD8489927.1 hypothetical protein [Desertifilum sp.]MDI9641813.1 hypothetical protein [Geitlerinema splendidum]MDL5052411.1 hypothetical protein [Oscillatoria laete-virens NRMC-F 0139]
MKIGHIEIGCETDIDTLVISQLQTGSVWFIPEDRFPRNGMIRAIVAAGDTEIGDRLIQSVAQCLTHPELSIRTEAVAIVQELPKRFGVRLILTHLQNNLPLYREITLSEPSYAQTQRSACYTLEESLLAALAAIVDANDSETIAYLRQAALAVTYRRPIASRLAILDTEWVLNHVPELVSGEKGGSVAKGILLCLPSMVAREIFIYQLKVSSLVAQEQILFALKEDRTFARVIPEADRQKLLVLLQVKIY